MTEPEVGVSVRLRDRVIITIGAALLTVCLLVILGFIVALVRPVKVVVLMNQPVPIVSPNKTVTAGGDIIYRETYCKYQDPPSTRMRQLVSEDGKTMVALPIVAAELPIGCHALNVVENIPSYVPPGRYTLEVTRVYRLYRLRDIPITMTTEPFTVLSPIAKVNR